MRTLLLQGILQERLSTHRYPLRSGEGDPQQFHTVVALNFAQSVACLAWAAVYVSVFFGFGGGSTPWWMYWRAGLSNTVGPACGAIALKNIRWALPSSFSSEHDCGEHGCCCMRNLMRA